MIDDGRKSRGRRRESASFPAPVGKNVVPTDYQAVLERLKERIRAERLRVTMSANSAMVLLYWDIGKTILERQQERGWGARIIDRLSHDLNAVFPDMSGFSPRNLKYMRAFAEAWPDRAIVQRTVAQLPWRSNLALIEKLEHPEARLWYAQKTIENGWSRDILALQIESGLRERQGRAVTNFPVTMPPSDSDMAAQVFKDPYLFDFLGTADPRREREVERALVDHIQRFLLEMGAGFAFVGQMNLYLSAVDDLLRHPDDEPTIGLLLCKGKNRVIVEYALRGFTKPVGVADWETRLVGLATRRVAGQLAHRGGDRGGTILSDHTWYWTRNAGHLNSSRQRS